MSNIIQTLLNSYESPVFLSDAWEHTILHTNDAVNKKLGFSEEELTGMHLDELLDEKQVIQSQTIWKHRDNHYLVEDEELTLAGVKYLKSNLRPFRGRTAYYLHFQKEMARRLVHRLRSPLNSVSGFTELLSEKPLHTKQQQYIASIKNGLGDLSSVLEHIETLANQLIINKNDVDLFQLAQRIKYSFPDAENRIQIIFDTELKEQHTDIILITSILKEFLLNAIQHGAKDPSPIKMRFMEDRIRVHNEGRPIPPSLAPNIFYPFFTNKTQKTGIGLAKCAYYADALGLKLKLAQNSKQEGIDFDIIWKI